MTTTTTSSQRSRSGSTTMDEREDHSAAQRHSRAKVPGWLNRDVPASVSVGVRRGGGRCPLVSLK